MYFLIKFSIKNQMIFKKKNEMLLVVWHNTTKLFVNNKYKFFSKKLLVFNAFGTENRMCLKKFVIEFDRDKNLTPTIMFMR